MGSRPTVTVARTAIAFALVSATAACSTLARAGLGLGGDMVVSVADAVAAPRAGDGPTTARTGQLRTPGTPTAVIPRSAPVVHLHLCRQRGHGLLEVRGLDDGRPMSGFTLGDGWGGTFTSEAIWFLVRSQACPERRYRSPFLGH